MLFRNLIKVLTVGIISGTFIQGAFAQEASKGFIEYKSGNSAEITIEQYSSSQSEPNVIGEGSNPLRIEAGKSLTLTVKQGKDDSHVKNNQVIMTDSTSKVSSSSDLSIGITQLGNNNVVKFGGNVSSTSDLTLNLTQDSSGKSSGNTIELSSLTLGGGTLSVKQTGGGNTFTLKNSNIGAIDGKVLEKGDNNIIILSNLNVDGTLTLKGYDGASDFKLEGNDNQFTAQNITANNLDLLATVVGSDNRISINNEYAGSGDITNKFNIDGSGNTITIAEIQVADGRSITTNFKLNGSNIQVVGVDSSGNIDSTGVRQTSSNGPSFLEVIAGSDATVGVVQLNASEVDPDSGYSNYAYIKTAAGTTVKVYQDAHNSGYNKVKVENSNPEVKVIQTEAGTHVYP